MRYLTSFLLLLFFCLHVFAADALKQANDMLKTRNYNAVIETLNKALPELNEEEKNQAYLLMGIAAHKNAVLYNSLQSEAIESQLQYYTKLSKRKRKQRSSYSYLYLGQVYLAKHFYGKAMRNLTRFSRQKNVNKKQKIIGDIDKAIVLYHLKRKAEANRIIRSVRFKDAEIMSHLLVAKVKMHKKPKNIKQSMEDIRKMSNLSVRAISNLVYLYNVLDEEGAYELIGNNLLDKPVYTDSINERELKFYDPNLIANLSRFYQRQAVRYLSKISKNKKHGPVASYYLGKSYLETKNYANVSKMATEVKQSEAPETFKVTADIWQHIAKSKGNKRANGQISGVVRKHKGNNKIIEDALLACIHVGATCDSIVTSAQERVKLGNGLKFSGLNFALGKYFIGKKQLDLALSYLEAARDKSKKNRIDANDPILLVNLANVYRRTHVFSENLEIYFEMSKYYPVVRQIQNAVQGIYSMEQKSAGDVKIL